jgi:hypothetical protein
MRYRYLSKKFGTGIKTKECGTRFSKQKCGTGIKKLRYQFSKQIVV